MDAEAALGYLDAHLNREAVAGEVDGLSLEPVRRLLHVMADPHLACPVVHVTGTNGKGSVCHLVSALLEASGLTVGLFTSPHLERVNERIARNRDPVTDEELADAIGAVAEIESLAGVTPSYFEILTAAAFGWFAQSAVDVVVAEVGLLGRFDATNVVDSDVAVVTNVGRDHTDGRGDWRLDVATEKAGIVKPGSVAVIGESDPRLEKVFRSAPAREHWFVGEHFRLGSDIEGLGGRLVGIEGRYGEYPEVFLSLHGAHQAANSAIAVAAAEAFFGRALPVDVVTDALGSVSVPGRFEIVGRHPLVVLDGAHNPEGAIALGAALEEIHVGGRRIFVLGALDGRDVGELIRGIGAGGRDLVLACRADSPRAVAPASIEAAARERGVDAEVVVSVPEAVARARELAREDDAIVVTGSLYVVGEARPLLSAKKIETARRPRN